MYRYLTCYLTNMHKNGNLRYTHIHKRLVDGQKMVSFARVAMRVCMYIRNLCICVCVYVRCSCIFVCKYVRRIDIYHVICRIYIKYMICLKLCIYVRCIDINHEILRQMQNERLCHLKTAILEKCQIICVLSRNLTHIHKKGDFLKFM